MSPRILLAFIAAVTVVSGCKIGPRHVVLIGAKDWTVRDWIGISSTHNFSYRVHFENEATGTMIALYRPSTNSYFYRFVRHGKSLSFTCASTNVGAEINSFRITLSDCGARFDLSAKGWKDVFIGYPHEDITNALVRIESARTLLPQ